MAEGMEIFYMMKMTVVSLVFNSIVDVNLHNYDLEFVQSWFTVRMDG